MLLRREGHYEIVANGTFLMDTRGGASERLHVIAAADLMPPPGRMLIGGLGVGFSLAAALAHPRAGVVHVVERERAVLRWNSGPFAELNGGALGDPRVRAHEADVVEWLQRAPNSSLDAICLDVDNGPDWLVTPGNAWLYGDDGLRALVRVLAPGGVVSIWSAGSAPEFLERLEAHFADVAVTEVPAARGEPDVIMVGRAPCAAGARVTGGAA